MTMAIGEIWNVNFAEGNVSESVCSALVAEYLYVLTVSPLLLR
jgi:hypothetical protein